MTDHTEGLLSRARAGEHAAWDELYALYGAEIAQLLERRLGRRLRRKVDTADLVQSVYLEAFQRLDDFEYRGPESFAAWLRTLAETRVRDRGRYFRAHRRDLGREVSWASGFDASSAALPAARSWKALSSPSRGLRLEESAAGWQRAFEALDPRDREILRLHRIEQLSTQAIAERLQCTQRNVQLRLAEAMVRLHEQHRRSEAR